MYAAERKSDSEIDNIAKTFEETFDGVVAADDYNLILRHLDYKGLMTQFKHILKFEENIEFETVIFQLLDSSEGDELLKELRNDYLANIVA